jgi:hypothetical protein
MKEICMLYDVCGELILKHNYKDWFERYVK